LVEKKFIAKPISLKCKYLHNIITHIIYNDAENANVHFYTRPQVYCEHVYGKRYTVHIFLRMYGMYIFFTSVRFLHVNSISFVHFICTIIVICIGFVLLPHTHHIITEELLPQILKIKIIHGIQAWTQVGH